MLRIGLSGGIGAGKSTVSSTFNDRGGIVVDGDVISREVVEPGTEGLAKLVDAFGEQILSDDGSLNRPALAAIAFSDEEKRQTLNGIVHPLVGRRRSELIAAAGDDAVIVEDIPLLVESGMAPMFPLVVIVNADEDVRVQRLIEHRGFSEEDARARIAAQASEEQRRAVADVWLDNAGSEAELTEQAVELWNQRILPFKHNLSAREVVRPPARLSPADPTWAEQARRIVARLEATCGSKALRVDHIGSTAVQGLDAKDAIDVQITVESLVVADELAESLLSVGYPRIDGIVDDVIKPDARSTVAGYDYSNDAALWHKRIHGSADPGRPSYIHLRVDGWPNQQFALLFVDWLTANADERASYLAEKRRIAAHPHSTIGSYADAKEPWFLDGYRRAWAWADSVNWRP